MKNKIIRIWGLVMVVAVLAGLLVPLTAVPVSAGNLIFSNLPLPTGINGQFTQGTSIDQFALGPDGKTAFAYSNNLASTTVNATSGPNATSITVLSTNGFANSGYLQVGADLITYTAKTTTTFSGIPSAAPNNLTLGHVNGDPVTQSGQIFKSLDGGMTWNNLGYGTGLNGTDLIPGNVKIVALAVSPQFATDTTVIAASMNTIYRSTDGGANFATFTPTITPAIAGTITSAAIGQYYLGGQAILVGYSTGNGTGGAALFVANTFTWTNLNTVAGWGGAGQPPVPAAGDVIGVAFSPKYASDSEILVVSASTTGTYLRTRVGSDNWDIDIGAVNLLSDQSVATVAAPGLTAQFAFPNDYDWSANNRVFIGLGSSNLANITGGLNAYRVNGLTGSTNWAANPISQTRASDLDVIGTGAANAVSVSDIAFAGPLATGTLAVATYAPIPANPNTAPTVIYTALGAATSATFVASNYNTSPFSGGGGTQLAFAPTAAAGKPYVLYVATQGPTGSHSALFWSTDYMNYQAVSLIGVSALANLVPGAPSNQPGGSSTWYMTMRDQRGNLTGSGMNLNDLSMVMKSTDGGNTYIGVFSHITATAAPNGEYLQFNVYSPTIATDGILYNYAAAGPSASGQSLFNRIYKSTDGGNTWASFTAPNSVQINTMALIDANTYYIGAAAVSGGGLWKSGLFTQVAALDGKVPFAIFAGASFPPIGDPNVVFVATTTGEVYYSSDGAVTFTNFGGFGILGSGAVSLVIDSNYKTNKLIYATGQVNRTDPPSNIFRWQVGTSSSWDTLATLGNTNFPLPVYPTGVLTTPPGGTPVQMVQDVPRIFGLGQGADGTMYVTVMDQGSGTAANTKYAPPVFYRCNNPTLAPTAVDLVFTQMSYQQISGFPINGYQPFATGTYPFSNAIGGSQFATIGGGPFIFPANQAGPPPVTANQFRQIISDGSLGINLNGYPYQFMALTDTMVVGPGVTAPTANAQVPTGTTFTWSPITGATGYRAQLATDNQFQGLVGLPIAINGLNTTGDPTAPTYATGANSITVPTGSLNPGITYFFRVQTVNPLVSKFSAPVSFSVLLSQSGNSLSVQGLYGPTAGAINVPVKPVFQWADVQGAQSYDLQVADNPVFVNPIDAQTGLNTTVWTETKTLNAGATYYWRVRAVAANGTASNWVAGSFTTALPASATAAPPPVIISTTQAPPITVTAPPPPAQTVTVTPPARFFDPNSGLYFNSQAELSQYQAAHPSGAAPAAATPAYTWVIIVIGAILVIAVIVLIVRTRRA